jgi:hypothetical protein
VSVPPGSHAGIIERFDLTQLTAVNPVRTVESPFLASAFTTTPIGQVGQTILPFSRTLAPLHNGQSIILLLFYFQAPGSPFFPRTDTWFAWSGPTTVTPGKNIAAYYRIQGPKLVIEYAPQRLGGDPTMHIHTMYRDPTNDYGRGVTAK